MSFSLLFSENGANGTCPVESLRYIEGFCKGIDENISLDINNFNKFIEHLGYASIDFPHIDGVAGASPFKKAAYFYVGFIICKPIISPLTNPKIPEDIRAVANHQNSIIAYHLAIDSLCGAKLHPSSGNDVTISNRVKISKHFFKDLIHASSNAVVGDYRTFALLFEALVYQENDISNPKVI